MRTFRTIQKKVSGLTALVFFLSTMISACGGPSTPSAEQPTADVKMLDLFERAWPMDSVQGINAMLEQEGFTAATDQLMSLFQEGTDIAILIPYNTSDTRNAAIGIIEDAYGIHVSAAIVSGDEDEEPSVVVTWNGDSVRIEPLVISSDDDENPEGTQAYHWCTSDAACCFWGCMLGLCGIGAFVCLFTGPALWACILGVCGSSAYGCWYSCY